MNLSLKEKNSAPLPLGESISTLFTKTMSNKFMRGDPTF